METMESRTCALCGETYTPTHRSLLCDACQEAERVRVRRRLALNEVVSAAVNAVNAAARFSKDYPEAEALVIRLYNAIGNELPALDKILTEMREAEKQRDAKIYAAKA